MAEVLSLVILPTLFKYMSHKMCDKLENRVEDEIRLQENTFLSYKELAAL